MKSKILMLVLGIMLAFGTVAYATVDVIQSSTGYFVPTDAQKYDSPYYRWYNGDWDWSHNAIVGSFSSATLSISAFDIDYNSGEIDNIYAYDGGNWVLLGHLVGQNDEWAYDTFNLDLAVFGAAINSGLQVKIDIDSTHNYDNWAVTLAKSVLTLDGGVLPPPEPNPTPEPATMLLLGLGLVGLAGLRKKM